MPQCAACQFDNELVERLSVLANRFLRPPISEGGTRVQSLYHGSLYDYILVRILIFHISMEASLLQARLAMNKIFDARGDHAA